MERNRSGVFKVEGLGCLGAKIKENWAGFDLYPEGPNTEMTCRVQSLAPNEFLQRQFGPKVFSILGLGPLRSASHGVMVSGAFLRGEGVYVRGLRLRVETLNPKT